MRRNNQNDKEQQSSDRRPPPPFYLTQSLKITVLILTLALALASCTDDGGGGGNGNNDGGGSSKYDGTWIKTDDSYRIIIKGSTWTSYYKSGDSWVKEGNGTYKITGGTAAWTDSYGETDTGNFSMPDNNTFILDGFYRTRINGTYTRS
jgi:hypothetical protein